MSIDRVNWDDVVSLLRHAGIFLRDLASEAWDKTGQRDEFADSLASAVEGWLTLIEQEQQRRGNVFKETDSP